ncbi:MAG TPA: hypothetical protein VM656_07500 [Pyrinomonadaceae bacterium]|jgi:hypothetical protein|nr:hypothetical protein [Pyrinomonadaceae bacterium]
MKINLYNLFTKVALLSAIVVATAFVSTQAQSLAYPITASIPFDFSVADTKLPAGKYSIARAKVSSDNSVLSIFDGDGNPKDIRHSIPVSSFNAKDKSTLIFHRYGDQYFLYQVWSAGETTGRQFLKSRAEREILRSLAASGKTARKMPVETVTVAGVLQ